MIIIFNKFILGGSKVANNAKAPAIICTTVKTTKATAPTTPTTITTITRKSTIQNKNTSQINSSATIATSTNNQTVKSNTIEIVGICLAAIIIISIIGLIIKKVTKNKIKSK